MISVLAGLACVLAAENPPQQVIEITVELRQGSDWKPVSSQRVFHANDDIRFRLRSRIPGYLYVLNHASSGERAWLYPRPNQGFSNHVEIDKVYLVPDTKGSFIVGGEPGFDVTYWMITPESQDISAADPATRTKPGSLLPRCREGLLRARGVCEDQQAGPHSVSDSSEIPPLFSSSGGLISRDLKFQTSEPAIRISTPEPQSGSIVYALWIAHR